MADEQYRWLDRDTAERLLRGESLEAVDAEAHDQAERLAKTLDALSVEPLPTSAELPGEAAALAAFRTARAERGGERAALGDRTRGRSSDTGLVRVGGPDQDTLRPLRARAVRLGLAAALALGMVGGVAVAAGTGALPTPFGDAEPEPAASVSVAGTPKRPFVSPSPRAPRSEPSPDGATGGSSSGQGSGQDSSRDTARGGSTPDDGTGPGKGRNEGRPWSGAPSACRAVRDGEHLTADRRRTLESAAGGSSRVSKYCKGVLAGTGSADDDTKSSGKDGKGNKGDKGNEGDKGDRGDDGKAKGDVGGHPHLGGGDGNGRDGGEGEGDGDDYTSPAAAPHHPKRAMTAPGPAPAPTYSAL